MTHREKEKKREPEAQEGGSWIWAAGQFSWERLSHPALLKCHDPLESQVFFF